MKKIIGIISIAIFAIACNNNVKTVKWVSSNSNALWHESQLQTTDNKEESDSYVNIYPEKKQQIIDGFGGCFNELGWEALNLVPAEKEKIIKSLFDTVNGCKFNICRMPIGANDYAVDWYSHNGTKGDFKMENFSIERDKKRLIPYIKEAKVFNPELEIWASPWCPPAWMKTNNHYACTPDVVNDLSEEGKGVVKDNLPVVTQFRMKKEYLEAYSLYFSKFLNAYNEEGIDIYAVHVQNEPNSCQNFPSCIWTPKDLTRFIGEYLGPKLSQSHPETELWLGTIERPQVERIDVSMLDENAKKYIKGVGFQWGGKGAIEDVNNKYPDYKLMQTETVCGKGNNDWKAAEKTFNLMKHYFKNGVNSYMYWNMVLNETGKSQWGWKQNSMISIDTETKKVTYNPEFYLMKHFSYFIDAGAVKIETSDENCLAFENKDSIIVIYYNEGEKTEKTFAVGTQNITVVLPGKSFNTFIF